MLWCWLLRDMVEYVVVVGTDATILIQPSHLQITFTPKSDMLEGRLQCTARNINNDKLHMIHLHRVTCFKQYYMKARPKKLLSEETCEEIRSR